MRCATSAYCRWCRLVGVRSYYEGDREEGIARCVLPYSLREHRARFRLSTNMTNRMQDIIRRFLSRYGAARRSDFGAAVSGQASAARRASGQAGARIAFLGAERRPAILIPPPRAQVLRG
jgi:hypothetical protein